MRNRVGDEARQRNGIAVQRIFDRSADQRARTAAQFHRDHGERATVRTGSDRYDGCESTGPSFRVSSTSAAALVGTVGRDDRGVRPAWCDPRCGRLLSRSSLDVPSRASSQMKPAEHTGALPPSHQQPLLAGAAPEQQPTGAVSLEDVNGASRSCFRLEVQKAQHARGIDTSLADAALTPYEARKAQRRAYHHQQAVLRHERTIPRRRVVDPYVHLTGAQADVCLVVPNTYTADRLVERNGGRWVLDNPHRQQLYKGEPIMTRLMQGEFYREGAARRAAGEPRHYLLAKNRRDVRVVSEINRAERQRRQSPSHHCVCSK
ncbi:hypothetical protein conserved [Leishmania donovani]|uniref:Uncharacterized protein n=3 Tax=Leishmania donovani species complex TaxID=38574 RepID=A4I4A0_LEIIN|nr:conserved hypothetical protein [Leishmania infantum JPCM5]XP_003862466.1 hypothetical protein, conserved [Leishmania donovani]CAC9507186.1 hypothetical_protein_-_conserved [Leishmania infantum]AYU80534.1 hypothetical protein LdCL_290009700 [Leishmania donovani]TPP50853.1 hypothetical protein CGC20_25830 [Leishmania donovani]TPP52683.1 hypothetical protein CGC21_27790 [Leishmania donovani]CAJ1990518.1 hypothetical protein conserved [Leishmania donovani]|eukprot:XP_001466569.1 conserved hypothetical protein [Leishmania infantum JPCM5]